MTRDDAEARMVHAKAIYTRAARAALEGLPLAEKMAEAALAELNEARRALADCARIKSDSNA